MQNVQQISPKVMFPSVTKDIQGAFYYVSDELILPFWQLSKYIVKITSTEFCKDKWEP